MLYKLIYIYLYIFYIYLIYIYIVHFHFPGSHLPSCRPIDFSHAAKSVCAFSGLHVGDHIKIFFKPWLFVKLEFNAPYFFILLYFFAQNRIGDMRHVETRITAALLCCRWTRIENYSGNSGLRCFMHHSRFLCIQNSANIFSQNPSGDKNVKPATIAKAEEYPIFTVITARCISDDVLLVCRCKHFLQRQKQNNKE